MKKLFQPTNYIDSWYLMRNALNFFVENKALNLVTLLQVLLASIFIVGSFYLLSSDVSIGIKLFTLVGSYFLLAITFAYINTVVTTILLRHLQNLRASLHEGLKIANKKWYQIAVWSLLTNTFGVLAKLFEGPCAVIEKLTNLPISFNWTNSAYFYLPVLVSENLSLRATMSRSQDIVGRGFRNTVSIKSLVTIAFIFCLMILSEFSESNPVETTQAILYLSPIFLISFAIASSLELILVCALFLSIVKQKEPKHFDKTLLDRVFLKEHS